MSNIEKKSPQLQSFVENLVNGEQAFVSPGDRMKRTGDYIKNVGNTKLFIPEKQLIAQFPNQFDRDKILTHLKSFNGQAPANVVKEEKLLNGQTSEIVYQAMNGQKFYTLDLNGLYFDQDNTSLVAQVCQKFLQHTHQPTTSIFFYSYSL